MASQRAPYGARCFFRRVPFQVSMSTPAFWQSCLESFQRELTPQQFNTWIRPLRLELAGDGLRLIAPNRFVLQWVKERFAGRIEELAAVAVGRPLRLAFVVADAAERPAQASVAAAASVPEAKPVAARRGEQASLNPGFTFETFVAGKANQLARAAGLQVADHPTSYNPLFVYGGVGLGKTHLIQAIGNHILEKDPSARDPLHPRRDVCLRRRSRLSAQGVRRLQALLPVARPAADRRHPVLQRQEPHPGGVLLPVQHPDRGAQAGRHHLRHLPEGDSRASRSA